MYRYPKALEKLIHKLTQIPGIGRKTAQRIAFHVISMDKKKVKEIADAFIKARESTRTCSICHNISESDPCEICSSKDRDSTKLCVVEKPIDVAAIESTGVFNGKYHILGGVISAMDGIGAEDLNISDLGERIRREGVKEVIIALNPTHEGEITAHYLISLLSNYKINITRIGIGLPIGGSLEYTDFVTIAEAIRSRKKIK